MPLTTPNGHGLRAERDIERRREWKRKKWRLNRELVTEMMPSSCMLAGGVRYTQKHLFQRPGLTLRLTGPGPADFTPLIAYIFHVPPFLLYSGRDEEASSKVHVNNNFGSVISIIPKWMTLPLGQEFWATVSEVTPRLHCSLSSAQCSEFL